VPPLATSNAPASTLTTVLGQVRDAFDAIGDATTIQIGARYLEGFGMGNGPKVLFVPEAPGSGGAMAGAFSLGATASQIHGCNVYVRATEETADDLERFDQLYALTDRVVDLIETAGSGRLAWGPCSDDSPLRTSSGAGCGLGFSFTYRRDIGHDVKRWRGPLRDATGAILTTTLTAPADTSAKTLPTSPAATRSDGVTVTISAEAKDES
jgi:hypothetical protein